MFPEASDLFFSGLLRDSRSAPRMTTVACGLSRRYPNPWGSRKRYVPKIPAHLARGEQGRPCDCAHVPAAWSFAVAGCLYFYCHQRNLACTFSTEAYIRRNSVKGKGFSLLMSLGQHQITMVHIPGIDNNLGNLLSRRRTRQPEILCARQVAVVFSVTGEADFPLPANEIEQILSGDGFER